MLDASGFKRERYIDIYEDMADQAHEKFGADVDLSERTPLGIILRIFAWFLGVLWQVVERVYFSAYVSTAEGKQLDRLVPYANILRIQAQKARVRLKVSGDPGATVEKGFRFKTVDGTTFEVESSAALNSQGVHDSVWAVAVEPGAASNVVADTVKYMVNPVDYIKDVTNEEAASGGREEETDSELRARYRLARAGLGKATLSAVRAALMKVPGVRAAIVFENDTMQTSPEGLPPKSINVYVLGGEDRDIAECILENKAAGIETYGDVVMGKEDGIFDQAGQPHTIKFDRAEEVKIYVKAELSVNEMFDFNGEEQVKAEIIKYIGGSHNGSMYTGLNMGESVVYAKLVNVIVSFPGVEDVNLQIMGSKSEEAGEDGYRKENVTIEKNQVPQAFKIDVKRKTEGGKVNA